MNNPDIIKIMAKSKVKLSAALVLMLVLTGAATEYSRLNRPLAQAVVVLLPEEGRSLNEAQEVRQSAEEAVLLQPAAVEEQSGVSAEDFVRQLQEVSERALAISKPESALLNITLPVPQEVILEPEVQVNEHIIEVYDESGESVEIVEVRDQEGEQERLETVVEEIPIEEPEIEYVSEVSEVVETMSEGVEAAEVAAMVTDEAMATVDSAPDVVLTTVSEATAESGQNAENRVEDVEKTQENLSDVNEEGAEMPEVDMMKEIIEREAETMVEN